MSKRSQCPKPAMFEIPAESGGSVPLCLDCCAKYERMLLARNEELERVHNYLMDQMEATVGLSGVLPRYPERRPVQIGEVHLNNIKVDRSTIGVLNVGNLEMVDSAVTVLKDSGQDDKVAEAILALTQAVLASGALDPAAMNEALELLGGVAAEASAPKERRRSAMARTLLEQLGKVVGTVAALKEIWDGVKPVLDGMF